VLALETLPDTVNTESPPEEYDTHPDDGGVDGTGNEGNTHISTAEMSTTLLYTFAMAVM